MERILAALSKCKKLDFELCLVVHMAIRFWGVFICLLAWLPCPLFFGLLRTTRIRHV